MGSVYHLGLSRDIIKEAKFVILPGDPERVHKIAKTSEENATKVAVEAMRYLIQNQTFSY